MGWDKNRKSAYNEPFVAIFRSVFDAPVYKTLGPWACKLLLDILSQFKGDNNGDLSIPWSRMSKCGWNSKTTLWRAKNELEAAGYIHVTRAGRRPSVCQLLAVTWFPLNLSKKFDDEALITFRAKAYGKGVALPMPQIKKRRDWTLPNGGMAAYPGRSPSPPAKP